MKRLIITVVVALLVAFGGYIYHTRPCIAGMCQGYWCHSAADCVGDCYCLKDAYDNVGQCVSIE